MENVSPTTHRISEFHKWNKEGRLELRPPFQRKPVWSDRNRSYLIDSILNNYPVPEVYVQIITSKEGHTKYIVVDGQQRIRAILDFIEGRLTILESESEKYGGSEFKELLDNTKKEFWDYSIVTREIKTSNSDDVRAIFRRLNRYVVPLNKQELRNATFRGRFIQLMSDLSEDTYWTDNKIVGVSDIKRMRDVEFISLLFVSMMEGIINKSTDLDKYYQMYDIDFRERDMWKKHFIRVQSIISDIFGDLVGTHWKTKTDFYSLFIVISDLLKKYIFPADKYDEIKTELDSFRTKVNLEKEQARDKDVLEYYDSIVAHSTDRDKRKKRNALLKKIILPFLIPKDNKRNFTEDQRQFMWDLSKEKRCTICKERIEWKDYDLDHKIPYSQGGRTNLKNAQITHKQCNRSKSNK